MRGERVHAALVILFLAAGAVAWWLELRPLPRADVASLQAIPVRLGEWYGEELPVDATVESMLRADANVQRAYHHPLGELVWLYLGYYGTARGGTPEHTPRACYAAHGWSLVEERRLPPDPAGLRAVEYLMEQGDERELVHFWYRSFRRARMLGLVALRLDHALGQLRAARGDGALVHLSTRLPDGDVVAARSRLLSFGALLEPELARHWPGETTVSSGR